MNIFLRFSAALVGMVAGGCAVALVEWISIRMHPMPEGLQMDDIEGVKAWVRELPTSAFLMLLVAWSAGCGIGTFVARRIAPGRSAWPAIVVCVLLTLATIGNLIALPHPWWLWPTGIGACLIFGCIGMLLAAPSEYLVATTRVIGAPVENVFQTLARIENFSKAVPGITKVEFLTDKRYGVGTRFRETRLMQGKEASTELEVTELEENKLIRMVAHAGGTIWDTVFNVEPVGREVQMQMQMAARPQNLASKLLTPLILGMVSKAVESDMDSVKLYCELQDRGKKRI